MTEDEAIQRCQDGEREAFHPLVEWHQDVVFGTAYHLTGHAALAEEVAQEAFLAAWQGIRGFRRGRPFKPWLLRILVNTVLAQRRQRTVETTPIAAAGVAGDTDNPAAVVEAQGERQRLQEAINGLSPEHRQVVVLRYFAELTVPEVARAAGVPEGTVKSRLHRAQRALRQRLADAQQGQR